MAEFDSGIYLTKALDIEEDRVIVGYYKANYKHFIFDVFADIPHDVEINPYTLCRNTGIKVNNKFLYENDIVSYVEPMRDKKNYGFIDFDDFYKCYIVRTGIEQRATRLLKDCAKIENTGKNISLSDNDFKWFVEWEKSEFEKSRAYVIDNSYCPNKFKK